RLRRVVSSPLAGRPEVVLGLRVPEQVRALKHACTEALRGITRWLVSFLLRRTCTSRLTRSTSHRRMCFTSTGRIVVLPATIAAQYTCSHSGFEAAVLNSRRRS